LTSDTDVRPDELIDDSSASSVDPVAHDTDTDDDTDVTSDLESSDDAQQGGGSPPRWRRRMVAFFSPRRTALIAGLGIVAMLAGLGGWMGWQVVKSDRVHAAHSRFLEVGRQAALNLTTIDWQNAERDVQRIIDSSAGPFYEDFSRRSSAFVDVVKQSQSKSEGTVTAAGLESTNDSGGTVLVAVNVKTSNGGAPEQNPRSWRMRITVQSSGSDVKVTNVEFVP
jgi:Mce-associated membrane protein